MGPAAAGQGLSPLQQAQSQVAEVSIRVMFLNYQLAVMIVMHLLWQEKSCATRGGAPDLHVLNLAACKRHGGLV